MARPGVLCILGFATWSCVLAEQTASEQCDGPCSSNSVALLQTKAVKAKNNCTMADVFGSDSSAWPSTVAEARDVQLAYCQSRGYDSHLCSGLVDEHFQKHSFTVSAQSFTMTETFCLESLALLKLDGIHHADASLPVQGEARPTKVGDLQTRVETLQHMMDDCEKKTCADGEPMVYHSWTVGCVCKWCEKNTWSQIQLCRRKCYTGDTFMCAQCFPSDAAVSVQLLDGAVATRTMEQLRVGDAVLTKAGFSKIFAFMDNAAEAEAEYVQLETASGFELSVTADHIVYAHGEQMPVMAGSIVKGDLLWTLEGRGAEFVASQVVSVRRAAERGMHAPLTEQGSVVVNGVLSSSYAKVKSLRWGTQVIVSGHSLNKYMHEPLRLACSLVAALCGPDWHSAEGRHVWTQFILDNFGWLQAMNHEHSDIQAALFADPSMYSWLASFVQLSAALLLSTIFGQPPVIMALGAAYATHVAARRSRPSHKSA